MKIIREAYHILKFPIMKVIYALKCRNCKFSLEEIFTDSEKYILLLTHNYGDGTLTYENNLISESEEKVNPVLHIENNFDLEEVLNG